MKKIIILGILLCVASSGLFAQEKAGKVDTTRHTAFYSCPMHADITSFKAGKCPKCGMDLSLSSKEEMKSATIKNYICPIHVDMVSHDPGKCPKCGKTLNISDKEQMKAEVTKSYTCPMHPEVTLTKTGICPKCGKDLVEKVKK